MATRHKARASKQGFSVATRRVLPVVAIFRATADPRWATLTHGVLNIAEVVFTPTQPTLLRASEAGRAGTRCRWRRDRARSDIRSTP